MLNIATEISQLVHNIKSMDTIGVKIASVEGSVLAQHTTAEASTALYNVITKCARVSAHPAGSHHLQVVTFIQKIAEVLCRPSISAEMQLKLAAAVAADDALTAVIQVEKNPVEHLKFAEAQLFGREFIIELLQGVI